MPFTPQCQILHKAMLLLLRSLDLVLIPSARLQTCVPLLTSHHLAHIRLCFADNSPERCLSVIQILIEAPGSLESVEIIPEFDRHGMQDAVSKLLLSCNPNILSSFCVASLISEAALHAAQLPGLQEFSVRGGTSGLSDPLPLTIFPSLRMILISMAGFRLGLKFSATSKVNVLQSSQSILKLEMVVACPRYACTSSTRGYIEHSQCPVSVPGKGGSLTEFQSHRFWSLENSLR